MRLTGLTSACALFLAASLIGCGSDGGQASEKAGLSLGRAQELCKQASRGDEQAAASFADPKEDEPVRLIFSAMPVQPGEQFDVAVANDSDRRVGYGVGYTIERQTQDGWEQVPGTPSAFVSIGLSARPRGVGSCFLVSVPSDVAPGTYRVVPSEGVPPGPFEVAGAPLRHPLWERIQALTARVNQPDISEATHRRLERRVGHLTRRENLYLHSTRGQGTGELSELAQVLSQDHEVTLLPRSGLPRREPLVPPPKRQGLPALLKPVAGLRVELPGGGAVLVYRYPSHDIAVAAAPAFLRWGAVDGVSGCGAQIWFTKSRGAPSGASAASPSRSVDAALRRGVRPCRKRFDVII